MLLIMLLLTALAVMRQSLFNIPTLLYGEESKEIYEDDIKSHMFTWINSDVDSFAAWLYSDDYISRNISDPYINNIKYNS